MSEETQTASASESTGTVEEAASKIEALLSGKKPTRKQEAPIQEAASEAEPAQAEEAETEDNSVETAPPSEEESDAEEASPDAQDEEAESDSPAKPIITLELEGKKVEFTPEELQKSVLLQADYTRKTQALAAERKQFAETLQKAEEAEKVYSQLLPVMVQRMQATLPQSPDPSLIDINPSAYLRQKEAYEQEMGDLQAGISEMHRQQDESKGKQSQQLQAYLAENASRLPELVPEWKDEKVFERDRPKVRDYLKAKGFSDEEINQAYDARLVAMANDARQWRELQSKSRPRPNAPPLEKALKPSPAPAQPQTRKNRDAYEARKRLASSGRVEDAAAAIKALL